MTILMLYSLRTPAAVLREDVSEFDVGIDRNVEELLQSLHGFFVRPNA